MKREKNRVLGKGGHIFGGRVLGRLAITRSFGDFAMKIQYDELGKKFWKNYLSVEPEVR